MEKARFRVSVRPLFFLPLCLLLVTNPWRTVLAIVGVLLAHESGHLLVALLQHRRLLGLTLHAGGVSLLVDTDGHSYGADLLLYLSGPWMNFLLCAALLLAIRAGPGPLLFFSFYFSALCGLFHLLPLCGTDGARALYALLCLHTDANRAYRICERVHRAVRLCATLACLILLFYSELHLSLCLSLCSLLAFFWGAFGDEKNAPAYAGALGRNLIPRPSLRRSSSRGPSSRAPQRPSR